MEPSSGISPHWHRSALLWLVLDREAARPLSMAAATEAAIAGGAGAVVFRHKSSPFEEVLDQAHAARAICRKASVPFVLAHELSRVAELEPDALHLNSGIGQLSQLRDQLSSVPVWGVSTHSIHEVQQREAEGFDYCFLGPIYPTPSKLPLGLPLGLDAVAEMHLTRPRRISAVFIGGVNPASVDEMKARGARQFAAIGAILNSIDPQNAAENLLAAIKRESPG